MTLDRITPINSSELTGNNSEDVVNLINLVNISFDILTRSKLVELLSAIKDNEEGETLQLDIDQTVLLDLLHIS